MSHVRSIRIRQTGEKKRDKEREKEREREGGEGGREMECLSMQWAREKY